MNKILKPTEVEGGDLVPFGIPAKDLQDEVNSRTCKAGYTNRHGDRLWSNKIMVRGFGKSKLNVWPRDENGELIG